MSIPATATGVSLFSTAIELQLANHLWQSTLFVIAAGLLALMLKKNRAQVRYWVWLITSLKFLVPFSLLVALGSQLTWTKPAAPAPEIVVVFQGIGQPFGPARSNPFAASAQHSVWPGLLLIAWSCGCVAVPLFWWLRWLRITKPWRKGTPASSGRELETLRRLEQGSGMSDQLSLILSQSALEPGILGIFRPVMVLPAGINERLSAAQLDAIIAHELCHVRRRDNLVAAAHMLVEAIFWFHPLVWWVGARMVDERERACDEEVLMRGSEPQAYAEGILKVCEFYLESPLVCVAGVTGSNLKKRIETIMLNRIAHNLDFGKRVLLAVLAVAVIAGPVTLGMLHPAAIQAQSQTSGVVTFESGSIQAKGPATGVISFRILVHESLGTLRVTNQTLKQLIEYAYDLHDSEISGGPDWVNTELIDMDIKIGAAASLEQYKLGLQKWLGDRFKLSVHRELKELPSYELRVGQNGPKLSPATIDNGRPKRGFFTLKPDGLEATGGTIRGLAGFLENRTGRIVIDKTGLTGIYDFKLTVPDTRGLPAGDPETAASLSHSLSEQLGLELIPASMPANTLVIDSAEKITGDLPGQLH